MPASQTITGKLESGGFYYTRPEFQMLYGRFETRVRVDADSSKTMSGVVLNWNNNEATYPWCDGEADFYETGTDLSVESFLHYQIMDGDMGCGVPNHSHHYCAHNVNRDVWHDIVLESRPDRWTVWNDGRLVCNITDRTSLPEYTQHTAWQLDAFGFERNGLMTQPVRMQAAYARLFQYVP
jgi:hypothetical protein